MATSITVESASYQGRKLTLTCVQTKNIEANTSTVKWTLTVSGGTSSYYTTGPTTVKINGTQVYYKARTAWDTYAFPAAKGSTSGTITINHNSSGAATIAVSLATAIYETTVQTVSKNWTLDSIPRESTVSATACNIDGTSTISVTRKNSNYTHSIAYSFKSLSGYITSSGGISSSESKYTTSKISFAIPASFATALGSSTSAACTLTIKTYSGSTQIGSAKTTTFTISTSNSNAPSVSGTVVDNNSTTVALTGDSSKLIKYYSTAYCTISATANDGASISTKKINGTTVSGNTRSISKVESGAFTFYAQDNRGYSKTITVNKTMVNYVKLTVNAKATRTSSTAGTLRLAISGNYFNGSFGAASNTLTLKYRYSQDGGAYSSYTTVTATKSGNTYSYSANLSGFDYTSNYEFEVVATDKLTTISATADTGLGMPIFDWGAEDFNFNVNVSLRNNMRIMATTTDGTLINAFQPANQNNNLTLGYGGYENAIGATHIYGDTIRLFSNNGVEVNGTKLGQNKTLWSGTYYMSSSHTITLNDNVSNQISGIVLVFSRYDIDGGAALNEHFSYHFVPKQMIALQEGKGSIFNMSTSNESFSASKYLYIYDNKIEGHANNVATGTGATGVKYENNRFVLRYVIGV